MDENVNLISVGNLTTESLTAILHRKFNRDQVYTWFGEDLLSLNLYRSLALYGDEQKLSYSSGITQPPHIWALVNRMITRLRDGFETNAILILRGKSGSGKSTNAQLAIDFVAGINSTNSLIDSILPTLQAFGNSRTKGNENASRFGVLIEVHLDFRSFPTTSNVYTYIFDKWSVDGRGENFHIFHMLLEGAEPSLLKSLRLNRSRHNYRILKRTTINGNSTAFQQIKRNLERFLGRDSAFQVFQILAALLKLGNVFFIPIVRIDGSQGLAVNSSEDLLEVSELLGTAFEDLNSGLIAGGHGQPKLRRDSILCAIYARLFHFISSEINLCFKTHCRTEGRQSCWSVLDMPGFEILEKNSVQELAVNLTNEKLESVLIHSKLKTRQEMFAREGIHWLTFNTIKQVSISPSYDIVDSLLMWEERAVERQTFSRLGRQIHPEESFRVEHSWGSVSYVPCKSSEPSAFLTDILSRSTNLIVRKLFPNGKTPGLLSSQLDSSLTNLISKTKEKSAYHLVCMKPNELKIEHIFEGALVSHQVKCLRLLDSLRVATAGFSHIVTPSRFLHRYSLLSLLTWPLWKGSTIEGVHVLLKDLCVDTEKFFLGRNLLFLKDSRIIDELENLRKERMDDLALLIQKTWRGWHEYKRYRTLRRAQRTISRHFRKYILRQGEIAFRLEVEQNEGARIIQSAYRQHKRSQYFESLHNMPMSPTVWGAWPSSIYFSNTTCDLLQKLFHHWRCKVYRDRFSHRDVRNRMADKVTASVIFSGKKASYTASICHPFLGDYVGLSQNSEWRQRASADSLGLLLFADLASKVTRSSGKLVEVLLVVTTVFVLVLDPRSLDMREKLLLQHVRAISLSPFSDDIIVIHVQPVQDNKTEEMSCTLFGGNRQKGDLIVSTSHAVEMVTKIYVLVKAVTGKPPTVVFYPKFDAFLGASGTVLVSFKCLHSTPGLRVTRKSGRLDFIL